jgi:hypothetical protein
MTELGREECAARGRSDMGCRGWVWREAVEDSDEEYPSWGVDIRNDVAVRAAMSAGSWIIDVVRENRRSWLGHGGEGETKVRRMKGEGATFLA